MTLTQHQIQERIYKSQPQIVSTTVRNRGLDNLSSNVKSGTKKTTLVAIAPLNALPTNMRTTKPMKVSSAALSDLSTRSLPEKFSWHKVKGYRGEQLTKPQNQGMCGCCWAMASATVISDNFVTAQILQNNPNLSTTWCLSCMQNPETMLGCNGGNPATLMNAIQKKGISTKSCTNWDGWCGNDPNCTPITDEQKTTARQLVASGTVNFNKNIPPCNCADDNSDYYLLNIKDAQNYWIGENDKNPSPEDFRSTIKSHIYDHGPVVTVFAVYKNFVEGLWAHTSHGVYLENYNYTKDNTDSTVATFVDPSDENSPVSIANFGGGHAVSIIGWGITNEKIKYDPNEDPDFIPYWVTRNTWTEDWGEGGYFKMAMYPYNKASQFDKPVSLKDASGNVVFEDSLYGGITLITLNSTIPTPTKINNSSNNSTMQVQQTSPSGSNEVPLVPVTKKEERPVQIGDDDNYTPTTTSKISLKKILIGLSIVVGVGLLVFLGIYLWKKYTRLPERQPKVNIFRKDNNSGKETKVGTVKTLQEVILPTAVVSPSTVTYDPLTGVSNTLGAKLYY